MVAFIIAAEIAFWALIAAGLGFRYGLGMKRTGLVLLAATPVVDLALLAATAVDLGSGATAEVPHALAAVYLGVSLTWGHAIIKRADVWVAHRFAGGPAPAAPPRYGRARARRERREWLAHLRAWAIGVGLLGLATLAGGGIGERTEALTNVALLWTAILAIDGIVALTYVVSPPKAPRGAEGAAGRRGRRQLSRRPRRTPTRTVR